VLFLGNHHRRQMLSVLGPGEIIGHQCCPETFFQHTECPFIYRFDGTVPGRRPFGNGIDNGPVLIFPGKMLQ
jgi:hypothetical protein